MALSLNDANDALQEVARTQRRAAILKGYEYGAPYFLLWGTVWLLGYAGTDLWPARAGLIWLVLDAVGIGGGYLIARATPMGGGVATGDTVSQRSWRYAASGACFLAFILSTYYLMGAHTSAQFGAFPALLMSLLYTLTGLWRGGRWAVVGVSLFVLTVVGFTLLATHFLLWMSLCGGGTLLLTGLWMRRA